MEKQAKGAVWDEGVIQSYINTDVCKVVFTLHNNHTLFLISHHSDEKNAKVAQELNKLLCWLDPKRPFYIFLWLREDPRHISEQEWPSRRSINGGWTIPGSSSICVYREEEWDRVVLHEMIHALEWDWKMPETPDTCWSANPGSYTPALFEAWTELLAEWFWCAWHSVSWSQQRKWQEFQALQILARHDLRKRPWDENTSIFAYYILKTALAPHMPFLWMHNNGDTSSERKEFLCRIVQPELKRLEALAEKTQPVSLSLRMTLPAEQK